MVFKKHVSPAGDNFYSVTDRRMGWQTIDKWSLNVSLLNRRQSGRYSTGRMTNRRPIEGLQLRWTRGPSPNLIANLSTQCFKCLVKDLVYIMLAYQVLLKSKERLQTRRDQGIHVCSRIGTLSKIFVEDLKCLLLVKFPWNSFSRCGGEVQKCEKLMMTDGQTFFLCSILPRKLTFFFVQFSSWESLAVEFPLSCSLVFFTKKTRCIMNSQ